MKLMRRRKPSFKTLLGITKVKRRRSKSIGISTTKQGRKRKALNSVTLGTYTKYTNARAAVNRPQKILKNQPTPLGCLIPLLLIIFCPIALIGLGLC